MMEKESVVAIAASEQSGVEPLSLSFSQVQKDVSEAYQGSALRKLSDTVLGTFAANGSPILLRGLRVNGRDFSDTNEGSNVLAIFNCCGVQLVKLPGVFDGIHVKCRYARIIDVERLDAFINPHK